MGWQPGAVAGPTGPEAVAAALVVIVTGQDEQAQRAEQGGLLTAYERYIQAGRQPRPRPLVRACNLELVELARDVLRRCE